MAAIPLSSCFRRTACFPLLSGIVLPAQTQSRRGHIFHFTLYMRLRYISTLFCLSFLSLKHRRKCLFCRKKAAFSYFPLLSVYISQGKLCSLHSVFLKFHAPFSEFTPFRFFVVFRTASRKRRFLFREPICTPCKRRKGLCSRPVCRRYNSRRLHCPTHHRSVRHFSRARIFEARPTDELHNAAKKYHKYLIINSKSTSSSGFNTVRSFAVGAWLTGLADNWGH